MEAYYAALHERNLNGFQEENAVELYPTNIGCLRRLMFCAKAKAGETYET